MKIRKFSINNDVEVFVKVLGEVLLLFDIEVAKDGADFDEVIVTSTVTDEVPRHVLTRAEFCREGEPPLVFTKDAAVLPDEKERSEINRLVKLNFYDIMREHFSMPSAPWGVLYGVRPAKIVHRFLDAGLSRTEIESRLSSLYDVSEEKAHLLTDIALYQRRVLPPAAPLTVGVYVGIPFCLSRCLYCSFPSAISPGRGLIESFMTALSKDIAAARRAASLYGLRVESVYVGGGTPTSLPDDCFEKMLGAVYEAFVTPDTAEFSVEAGRPDSMTREKLLCMRRYGVNRVSVNPQTMRGATLSRIGRTHTPEDIAQMYESFRAEGFSNINMDVIVGLPGETEEDVSYTMKEIASLAPDDVTLHTLAIKKGSRLKDALQSDGEAIGLPDDMTVRRMFAIATEAARGMGLVPYYLYRQGYQAGQLENIGFCRPGLEGIYNIRIMGERQTIIGIGGAATSKIIDHKRGLLTPSFNPKEVTVYIEKVDDYIKKRDRLLAASYTVK